MTAISSLHPAALLGEGFAAWFSVTSSPVTSWQGIRGSRIRGHGPEDTGLFWAVWLVKPPAPGARTPFSWGIAGTRAEVVDVMEAEAWVTLQSTAPFGELDPLFAEAAFRLHETDGRRPPPEVPFGPKSAAQRAEQPTVRPTKADSPEVEARVLVLRRELRRRIALDRLHPDQGGRPEAFQAVVEEYEARIAAMRTGR